MTPTSFAPRHLVGTAVLLVAAVSATMLDARAGQDGSHERVENREPILLSHRGLVRHAPENTLPAFTAAVELGLSIE